MKTRRVHVKKGKSRRFRMKRGGQRNLAIQQGGDPAPAPVPVAYINGKLDIASLNTSMTSVGNAINALNDAIVSNVNSAVQHVITAEAEAASSVSLQQAAASLKTAFLGGTDANGNAVVGLYNTIMKNSTYNYTPWSYVSPAADNTAAWTAAKSLYDASHPTGSPGAGQFPTLPANGVITASKIASSLGYTGPPLPA